MGRVLQALLLAVNPGANTARRRRGDIGWGGGVGGGEAALAAAPASSGSPATRAARRAARESRLAEMARYVKGRGNRVWEDDTSDDESERCVRWQNDAETCTMQLRPGAPPCAPRVSFAIYST